MASDFFSVEMLPVANGDSLVLEYGDASFTRRLLIDGGPIGTYEALAARIAALPQGNRTFEVVMLSHVDTDHVDGLIRLFATPKTQWGFDVKDVWFNGWTHLEQGLLGGNQGEYFSALIVDRVGQRRWNKAFGGKAVVVPDQGPPPQVKLADGLILTILSPDRGKLDKMREAWRKDVTSFAPGDLDAAWQALATQKKYLQNKTLLGSTPEWDAVLERQSRPDNSAANGSSIAVLAEYRGMSALLLADAHADMVAESIRRLLVQRQRARLQVDMVKVSHHGSEHNVSDQLLGLIESPKFLISTNGAIHQHPNEEAIMRIVAKSVIQPPQLVFNYRSDTTRRWEDQGLQTQLNFSASYPNRPDVGTVIRLTR